MTILAIGLAALAAVRSYNTRKQEQPEETDHAVRQVRQSVSVVLAIANAIWAVLDALIFLTRAVGQGNPSSGRPQMNFGRTPGGDVTVGAEA